VSPRCQGWDPAEMYTLEMYEKFVSITGDDFSVENAADTKVLKVRGFDTHM
jgi:hypothetical protein